MSRFDQHNHNISLTFDPAINAIPTDNFLFCPPDSVIEKLFLLDSRPRTPIISSTSF